MPHFSTKMAHMLYTHLIKKNYHTRGPCDAHPYHGCVAGMRARARALAGYACDDHCHHGCAAAHKILLVAQRPSLPCVPAHTLLLAARASTIAATVAPPPLMRSPAVTHALPPSPKSASSMPASIRRPYRWLVRPHALMRRPRRR